MPVESGWHVVTLRTSRDGRVRVEDPSARLGMLGGTVDNMSGYSIDDVATVGVAHRQHGRCVAAVGAIVGPYTFTAVGEALDVENDGSHEPPHVQERRTRARAARRALARLTDHAASIATAPERMAGSAISSGARAAARATMVRANRARADVDALEALDANDDFGDNVAGLGGLSVFDELAEKLYARR